MDNDNGYQQHFFILNQIPDGIFVLRQDFTVVFWNNTIEEWTKILMVDIVGTNILDRFPHLNQPKYLVRIQNIFEDGPPVVFSSSLNQYLIPVPLLENEFRAQHVTVRSLRVPEKEEVLGLFIIQDVTDLTRMNLEYKAMRDKALDEIEDRKKAEEALTEKMVELEQFNRLAVGRELKMIELKKEINALLTKAGYSPKYTIIE